MMADCTEQFEGPATTRLRPSAQLYTPRRPHGLEAPASIQRPARDRVTEVLRALANDVEPGAAQAQAATFYRSSGQVWTRSLGGKGSPSLARTSPPRSGRWRTGSTRTPLAQRRFTVAAQAGETGRADWAKRRDPSQGQTHHAPLRRLQVFRFGRRQREHRPGVETSRSHGGAPDRAIPGFARLHCPRRAFVADRLRPPIAGPFVPGEIEPEWPRG